MISVWWIFVGKPMTLARIRTRQQTFKKFSELVGGQCVMGCLPAFENPFSGVSDNYAVYPIIAVPVITRVEPFSRHIHSKAVNGQRHFRAFGHLPSRPRYLALEFGMCCGERVCNLPENSRGKTTTGIPRLFIVCFIHRKSPYQPYGTGSVCNLYCHGSRL